MTSHNIRKLLGFSQKDLADCFGIPIATVRNWDSKNCMPPISAKCCLTSMLARNSRLRRVCVFCSKDIARNWRQNRSQNVLSSRSDQLLLDVTGLTDTKNTKQAFLSVVDGH